MLCINPVLNNRLINAYLLDRNKRCVTWNLIFIKGRLSVAKQKIFLQ